MKKRTVAILMVIAIIVIALVSPYIKAEYLTYKYGKEFKDRYEDTHMIDDVDYSKVLEYSPSRAKICYVARDSGIYVFEFHYVEDGWQRSDWKAVWTKSGSVDCLDYFMWPMYF